MSAMTYQQAPVLNHIDITDVQHVRSVIEYERKRQAAKRECLRRRSEYNNRYQSNHKKQNDNEK